MGVGAVSSSLTGIAAAQKQMDSAASAAARSGVIGDSQGGDIVDSVTGGMSAQLQQSVSLAMLRRAMDMEKSLIDVIA
jgi:hypothetical protein